MELHVRRWNNLWYPVAYDLPHDATVELDEETIARYFVNTEQFFNMSEAIEAQIHGTS